MHRDRVTLDLRSIARNGLVVGTNFMEESYTLLRFFYIIEIQKNH